MKTKLTPDRQQKIIERLQAGATIKATCDSVGVTERSYYGWITRGQAEQKRREGNVKEGSAKWIKEDVFFHFLHEATRAIADGMITATIAFKKGMSPTQTISSTTETTTETKLRTIKHTDGTTSQEPFDAKKTTTRKTVTEHAGDWRAAMEYLARRDPDNWARKKLDIELTGKDGGDITIQYVFPKKPDSVEKPSEVKTDDDS